MFTPDDTLVFSTAVGCITGTLNRELSGYAAGACLSAGGGGMFLYGDSPVNRKLYGEADADEAMRYKQKRGHQ